MLKAARTRTRSTNAIAVSEPTDSEESKKKPELKKSHSAALIEEEEDVEKLRVDLIKSIADAVIREAAPKNQSFLSLRDFSKVVENDSEFFSHMNLFLST